MTGRFVVWLMVLLLGGSVSAAPNGSERPFIPIPLGLPPLPIPADNVMTPAKVDLGRKLFMDRRLSKNRTLSCGMCHVPEQGFTSNELRTAVGFEGRSGRRNAPTIYNVAYWAALFHDGRESRLEYQVWGPLLAANEMANPSIGYVIARINSLDDYRGTFEAAFDGRGADIETIGAALASYQRILLSGNSRFDRWYYGKEAAALGENEKRGFEIFRGRANCGSCHAFTDQHARFTDESFHNTGIGWAHSMGRPLRYRVQLAPGNYVEVDRGLLDPISAPVANDLGRYEVTQELRDRWAYRTPSLRNVELTAPYMHDGSLATLEEVVEFYDQGGIDNPEKDARLRPLGLSAQDKSDLVAFLRALTGDNVERLIRDARQDRRPHSANEQGSQG